MKNNKSYTLSINNLSLKALFYFNPFNINNLTHEEKAKVKKSNNSTTSLKRITNIAFEFKYNEQVKNKELINKTIFPFAISPDDLKATIQGTITQAINNAL